jgi:hypothetical protein
LILCGLGRHRWLIDLGRWRLGEVRAPACNEDGLMPRYFIDTFDSIIVMDDVGQDLPNEDAVRETLAGMLRDEHKGRPAAQFRAEVRDEAGKSVLTGSVLIVIDKAPERKTAKTSE